jgi:hypothetical protein
MEILEGPTTVMYLFWYTSDVITVDMWLIANIKLVWLLFCVAVRCAESHLNFWEFSDTVI